MAKQTTPKSPTFYGLHAAAWGTLAVLGIGSTYSVAPDPWKPWLFGLGAAAAVVGIWALICFSSNTPAAKKSFILSPVLAALVFLISFAAFPKHIGSTNDTPQGQSVQGSNQLSQVAFIQGSSNNVKIGSSSTVSASNISNSPVLTGNKNQVVSGDVVSGDKITGSKIINGPGGVVYVQAPARDLLPGTNVSEQDIRNAFPMGYIIIAKRGPTWLYDFQTSDALTWELPEIMKTVSVHPDFSTGEVEWLFRKLNATKQGHLVIKEGVVRYTVPLQQGRVEAFPMLFENNPTLWVGTLSTNQASPVFIIGLKVASLKPRTSKQP
jgi:hypothetical protein